MQTTTMSIGKAFRRTNVRYVLSDGRVSNYWVAYCMTCETARHRYEEAVAACAGDSEAVVTIDVVHAEEPLPGRADRMRPHLHKELQVYHIFHLWLLSLDGTPCEKKVFSSLPYRHTDTVSVNRCTVRQSVTKSRNDRHMPTLACVGTGPPAHAPPAPRGSTVFGLGAAPPRWSPPRRAERGAKERDRQASAARLAEERQPYRYSRTIHSERSEPLT